MGASGTAISLVDEATALLLEPIERFITQKIPVRRAEDDLFLPEIKPTAAGDDAPPLLREPIERFITQKIPVGWAEADLFLPEIKPTAEERRRYAEERRQRLAPPRRP